MDRLDQSLDTPVGLAVDIDADFGQMLSFAVIAAAPFRDHAGFKIRGHCFGLDHGCEMCFDLGIGDVIRRETPEKLVPETLSELDGALAEFGICRRVVI